MHLLECVFGLPLYLKRNKEACHCQHLLRTKSAVLDALLSSEMFLDLCLLWIGFYSQRGGSV